MCRGYFPRHERHITWACRTECTSGHRYSFCPGTQQHSCPGGCSWRSTAASCTRPFSVPSSSFPLSLLVQRKARQREKPIGLFPFRGSDTSAKNFGRTGAISPFADNEGIEAVFACLRKKWTLSVRKNGESGILSRFRRSVCRFIGSRGSVASAIFSLKLAFLGEFRQFFLSLAIRSRPFPRPFRAPVC